MKTKKLLICILVTMMLFNTNYINAFAAEENTTQTQTTEITAVTATAKTTTTKATTTTTVTKKVASMKVTKTSKAKSYSKSDLKLLACLIQAEAGNQPYSGKVAVANVVLNRIKSNKYSHVNTVKEVIYDKKWSVQFAVSVNGRLAEELKEYSTYSSKAEKSSIKAAKAALEGKNTISNYLNFTRYTSSLAKKHSNHKKIGNHIFF